MKKSIMKNGKQHFEGQTNERKAISKITGNAILKKDGYKVLGYGSYGFIEKSLKNDYSLETSTANYKHGLTWSLMVKADSDVIRSLGGLGWTVVNYDMATLTTNTRNKIKVLKDLDFESVDIEILTEQGNERSLSLQGVIYETLDMAIIWNSKDLLYIEKNGYSKDNYTMFPDFVNIH